MVEADVPTSDSLPPSVRAAAIVFLIYGLFVIVNATVLQMAAGWTEGAQYPRAVIRFLAMVLLAWGLFHRRPWAWWVGVGFSSFWLIAAAIAAGLMMRVAQIGDFPIVGPTLAILVAGYLLLLLGLVLLLLPASRRALRR